MISLPRSCLSRFQNILATLPHCTEHGAFYNKLGNFDKKRCYKYQWSKLGPHVLGFRLLLETEIWLFGEDDFFIVRQRGKLGFKLSLLILGKVVEIRIRGLFKSFHILSNKTFLKPLFASNEDMHLRNSYNFRFHKIVNKFAISETRQAIISIKKYKNKFGKQREAVICVIIIPDIKD